MKNVPRRKSFAFFVHGEGIAKLLCWKIVLILLQFKQIEVQHHKIFLLEYECTWNIPCLRYAQTPLAYNRDQCLYLEGFI